MLALVQRVIGRTRISFAQTSQDFEGAGLVALLGWQKSDLKDGGDSKNLEQSEEWIRSRIEGLRVFPDSRGRMNLSLEAYLGKHGGGGGILWVPQFTLSTKLESGFRPSFTEALDSSIAKNRFDDFVKKCQSTARSYAQVFGEFGADMNLEFTNWGPVTIPLFRG